MKRIEKISCSIVLILTLFVGATAWAASDAEIARSINTIIGNGANVNVRTAGDTLIIKGTVATQYDYNEVVNIASTYSKSVKNLISVMAPEAIKLSAKVYVVNLFKSKSLGVDWGTISVDSKGAITGFSNGAWTVGQGITNAGILNSDVLGGLSNIGAQLNFLAANGAARVAAEPNVITNSGTVADIKIGGQVVTPTGQNAFGDVTSWKNYGVILHIEPTLLPGGLISTRTKVEVSTLQWADSRSVINLGNGNKMPSIKQNQAETLATVKNGDVLVIGGLMSTYEVKATSKVPFLGDIPLLGWLFKSETTASEDQEVVILIEPSIVKTTSGDNDYDATQSMRDELSVSVEDKINQNITNQKDMDHKAEVSE